jgi:hypothetical protein
MEGTKSVHKNTLSRRKKMSSSEMILKIQGNRARNQELSHMAKPPWLLAFRVLADEFMGN